MKSSLLAAATLVVVLALWMLSGLLQPDAGESDAAESSDTESVAMSVEVVTAQSSLMAREVELQGQLEPAQHLFLKARTSGVVEQILVRRGARTNAGEELVQLDRGGRLNTLAEAQASVRMAQSEKEAAETLRAQRLQSQVQLEQREAALQSAMAQLAAIRLDISYTTINAPFAAVVNDIPVDVGALIERGDVVAELVDDSTFKVTARAAQQVLSELKVGQPVSVSLITGESLSGSLSFISSVADPNSRTFLVEAVVNNPGEQIAAGVSASLNIPVEEVQATFVSPSTLSLDSDGKLGVKGIDGEDRVIFLPISLISTALDGAWVTGIPDGQRIITLGQGFVNVGERVQPQNRAS
ncbi:MAG: efflux RND transporter periplasmic adaptor subunit [Granulosicoccus sp.]